MRKENNILQRSYYPEGVGASDEKVGLPKIGNAMGRTIAQRCDSRLFETANYTDKETIQSLRNLNDKDKALAISDKRRYKPVYLTVDMSKVVVALLADLSKESGGGGDVDKRIRQEGIKYGEIEDATEQEKRETEQKITRIASITELSREIYGSARRREKEATANALIALSETYQYQLIEGKKKTLLAIEPLISTHRELIELGEGVELIEITLGGLFFKGLDNSFASIPSNFFEVWGRKGRSTDLYANLQFYLLSRYNERKNQADIAQEAIEKDRRNAKLSREKLNEEIAKERRKQMTIELNVETIKEMTRTNYEGNGSNRKRFYKDLKNAVEGYKELDLLEGYKIVKGAKGQEKVLFTYSETYCKAKLDDGNEAEKPQILREAKILEE